MVGRAIPAAQVLKIAQRTCYHQQLPHGEDAALDGASGQLTDALHAAETGGPVFDEERVDGVGLLQRVAHLIRVALRL